MEGIITIALRSLWFLIPALIANGFPVMASKIIKKKHRIDNGINLKDGNPLFGKTKTIEGFISGMIGGALVGALLNYLNWVNMPQMGAELGLILGFGALTGDLIGSFIKRRRNLKSSQKSFLIDRIDILFGVYLIVPLTGLFTIYWIPFHIIYCIVFMKMFSTIGYILGLKKVPW